jgi:hypothetical protein
MPLGNDASLAINSVIKGKCPTFGSKLYAAADKPLSPDKPLLPTKGRAP